MPRESSPKSRLIGLSDAETVENVSHVLSMLADFIGDRPDQTVLTPEVRAGLSLMLDMAVDALGSVQANRRSPVPIEVIR